MFFQQKWIKRRRPIHNIQNHAVWMIDANAESFENGLLVVYLADKYIPTTGFQVTTIDRYDNFKRNLTIVQETIVFVAS